MHKKKLVGFAIFLAAIGVGGYLRFSHLGTKLLTHDEPASLIRMAGYQTWDVERKFNESSYLSPQDIGRFSVASGRETLGDINNFKEAHPPIYFALLRMVAVWTGDSLVLMRCLSGLLSLVTLVFVFLLCRELFPANRKCALLATALCSFSPLHVVYAQVLRPYSLFILALAISSWALLYAVRENRRRSWLIYALALMGGVYSHTLFAMVIASHWLFLFVIFLWSLPSAEWRNDPSWLALRRGTLSIFVCAISYVPWILFLWKNRVEIAAITAWASAEGGVNLPAQWLFHLTVPFTDLLWANTFDPSFPKLPPGAGLVVYSLVLVLLISSVVQTIRMAKVPSLRRAAVFLLSLLAFNAPIIILLDLTKGGYRSNETRYFIQSLFALQLMVSFLLSREAEAKANPPWLRGWRKAAITAVLSLGLLSSWVGSRASVWWDKHFSSAALRDIVNFIDTQPQPVMIFGADDVASLGVTLARQSSAKLFLPLRNASRLPSPVAPTLAGQCDFLVVSRSSDLEKAQREGWVSVYKSNRLTLYLLRRKCSPEDSKR